MTSSLSILIGAAVPADPNAGASGTVWQMAEALKRRGHFVENFWEKDLGRLIKHGNLHYLLELPYKYRREVRRRLSGRTFDVIELNQPHACLAARDHRIHGRPGIFVNRSHGHEVRSEEALAPWRERLGVAPKKGIAKWISGQIRTRLDRQWEQIARDSDGFVVSCSEDRDFLIDRYQVSTEQIGLITQGVPQAFLERPACAMSEERLKRLIYVGQVAFFKAPHMLAKAVTVALTQNSSASFTWVCGKQHHKQALDLIDPQIRPRVQMLDWMPQEQLISILDRHGIFLFPSYFEGFGKAPLEAMARGLCVVASDCGGMRDYISTGRNGFLSPVGQPEAMAKTAAELMNNVDLSQQVSRQARLTAESHTWDRCAADEEDFFRHLIDWKRKGGRKT